jgi:hypothetical protein
MLRCSLQALNIGVSPILSRRSTSSLYSSRSLTINGLPSLQAACSVDFFLACGESHKDAMKILMKYNCNMDIRDEIGHSALHAVCAKYSVLNQKHNSCKIYLKILQVVSKGRKIYWCFG